MRLGPVLAIGAASIAAFGGALLATNTLTQTAPVSHEAPPAAARTALPGYTAASTDPQLPGLALARPPAGTVVQVPGPFDDRFSMTELAFDEKGVTATVRITSDVSDILELEAVAGFYDAAGHLLGTGRFVSRQSEADAAHTGPPSEAEKISISVPEAMRATAVSAAVGVPVLVNE